VSLGTGGQGKAKPEQLGGISTTYFLGIAAIAYRGNNAARMIKNTWNAKKKTIHTHFSHVALF
jgi:hypothetical protein